MREKEREGERGKDRVMEKRRERGKGKEEGEVHVKNKKKELYRRFKINEIFVMTCFGTAVVVLKECCGQ